MRNRLKKLEAILQQRSAGSNWAYMNAIQHETDRIRHHLEAVISICGTGEPIPGLNPANPKDTAIIEAYEAANPCQKENRNGKLEKLIHGIRREGFNEKET